MRRRLIEWARGPAAKSAGLIACLAALFFFGETLIAAFAAVDVGRLMSDHWPALLAATGLYALAYVPMTSAWVLLAESAGARTDRRALATVLLTSQIAKYLPGNVAQFVGRAYAAQRIGVPLTVTGLAMALEVAGVLIGAAVLVGAAIGSGLGRGPADLDMDRLLTLIAAIIAVAAAIAVVAGRRDALRRSLRPFGTATLLHMLTLLLVTGGQLVISTSLLGEIGASAIGGIAAAILTGWLIGFVAPGAPAGLGLREITFVALLSNMHDAGALALAAAAFRLVTVAGDLGAWLIGLWLKTGREQAAGDWASG